MKLTRFLQACAVAAFLLVLAAPAASAEDDVRTCRDPQFPIGPVIATYSPEGSYWTPNGDYHVYGTAHSAQLWADNLDGVGAACLRDLGTAPFDWCMTCVSLW